MKRLSCLIFGIVCSLQAFAQTPEEIMYQAFISKDISLEPWINVLNIRKSQHLKDPKDKQARINLGIAQFGLLETTVKMHNEKLFDTHYDEIESTLESLVEENSQDAELKALLSSIYGLKIGFSPLQGMFLGPKCGKLIESAKVLSPASPLVTGLYGNSKLFTPPMWGGDVEVAIRSYLTCIELYEKNPNIANHNWLYLEAMLLLGQSYGKNNQHELAVATYEKLLKIEPDFKLVSEILLPKSRAKMAGKKASIK
jgi:tetratricopeptide (TPR) repeat protein